MNRASHASSLGRRGFALLEAMLAVAIFAIGIFGLGRCISQGLAIERLKNEDARAYRALLNREAEIEAGAVPSTDAQIKIDGGNGGMILKQTRGVLHKKDEHGTELANVYQVNLVVAWISDGETQRRSLNFYVWSDKL